MFKYKQNISHISHNYVHTGLNSIPLRTTMMDSGICLHFHPGTPLTKGVFEKIKMKEQGNSSTHQ